MYIFGIDIPLLEFLVIFCIVVVAYLVFLEIEFRQLRKITKKFSEEETLLSIELRELRKEVKEFKQIMSSRRR